MLLTSAFHINFRAIRTLDDLYRLSIKAQEAFLFCSVIGAIFGREQLQLTMLSIPTYVLTLMAFYSFKVEEIIDMEQQIRYSYYHLLEWYTAPPDVQRMVLLAMQEPMEIIFGAVYGKDRTSLPRFTDMCRKAYEFGLFLLKVTDS